MRTSLQHAFGIAIIAGLVVSAGFHAIYAADNPGADKVWSTKKVMDKVHVGKESLLSLVNKDLRNTEPDWKSDEANLTEIIRLMSMLTKQKPLRGSQEAWDKLVQDYVDGGKAARQNVKEHKVGPARVALERVIATCEECHDNHGIK
jgi:hypothetical protein